MRHSGEREVPIEKLSDRDRLRIYWGCYWRAAIYVVIQTVVLVPLVVFFTINPDVLPGASPFGPLVGLAITEIVSFGFGFVLVAIFTRNILKVRFGRTRFAVMVYEQARE